MSPPLPLPFIAFVAAVSLPLSLPFIAFVTALSLPLSLPCHRLCHCLSPPLSLPVIAFFSLPLLPLTYLPCLSTPPPPPPARAARLNLARHSRPYSCSRDLNRDCCRSPVGREGLQRVEDHADHHRPALDVHRPYPRQFRPPSTLLLTRVWGARRGSCRLSPFRCLKLKNLQLCLRNWEGVGGKWVDGQR